MSLEGLLREVPGTRSTFAERQTGREYIDIVPDREAIARYGLTVRDVQDVVEAAVGGMSVSTAIAGRSRFSINLRYAADQRSDPQALRRILVPVQATGSADPGGANAGAGASAQVAGTVASSAAGTAVAWDPWEQAADRPAFGPAAHRRASRRRRWAACPRRQT